MTNAARRRFLLILAGLLFALPAAGQDTPATQARILEDDHVQKLELTDGTTLYGRVLDASDPVRFQIASGDVLELGRAGIRDITPARGEVVDGKFIREDPNRTRLFFGPTGRALSKGHGYLGVYEIVMPFLAFAPVDNLVLSGGTPLVFGDGGDRIFWFAPKMRVAGGETADVAVGMIGFGGTGDTEFAGMAFAVATVGGSREALTAGIGFGWAGSDWADKPVFMVGGEMAVSGGVKLITENYLLPGEGGLVIFGPRFFGERLTADLGLAIPVTGEESIVLPIVNFVWNW